MMDLISSHESVQNFFIIFILSPFTVGPVILALVHMNLKADPLRHRR